jgi:hypothetical protein
MHDRGIRGSESCPQLKDASREADHLSMIFAADLERRPGFKGTAVATGENSPLKVGRRGAEPALTGYDPQSLVQIHKASPPTKYSNVENLGLPKIVRG